MDYKFRIVSTMEITGEVDNEQYQINEGEELIIQSQSIDKLKWFVFIPSIEKFDYIEKYKIDLLITDYIFYPQYYGEFQLPVISDNIHTYAFITPSGYVQCASKKDIIELKSYKEVQRISSDEIRFK
ncbi:hypothetical protein [Paenibacillus sp. NAIST15-1]|uniref:hypothetical protein n=1 Tax=Paenibacillus sp. NAIST15-1 TaxID=1605994 RepID=UPI000869664C|nr:hypothetical protein [Paenibacillus sp. NAIST15-1]GAV11346.1 response regulator receiver domain protein [Paenibacillus sp. NAIST15-1]